MNLLLPLFYSVQFGNVHLFILVTELLKKYISIKYISY